MRRGRTRRIGFCLLGAGVAAALAVSVAGCGGSTMDTLSKKLANPFSKKEVAASRRARRGDYRCDLGRCRSGRGGQADSASAASGQCILVGAGRRACEQSRPPGAERPAAESMGCRRRNGIVIERPLERGAAGRRRQGVHARCRGAPCRPFPRPAAARVWSASVTPENEKSEEGFGGGLALDGGHLYAATGYGTVVEHRCRQWRDPVVQARSASPFAARRPPRAAKSISCRRPTCSMRSARPMASSCGPHEACRKRRPCSAM